MKVHDDLRTVTLTDEQWNCLTTYLVMSTNYRKAEAEGWAKLAEETNEDGSPMFKHAAENAQYFEELDERLETIRKVIDGV